MSFVLYRNVIVVFVRPPQHSQDVCRLVSTDQNDDRQMVMFPLLVGKCTYSRGIQHSPSFCSARGKRMRLDHIGEKENATLRKLTEKGEKKTFSSFNRKKSFQCLCNPLSLSLPSLFGNKVKRRLEGKSRLRQGSCYYMGGPLPLKELIDNDERGFFLSFFLICFCPQRRKILKMLSTRSVISIIWRSMQGEFSACNVHIFSLEFRFNRLLNLVIKFKDQK